MTSRRQRFRDIADWAVYGMLAALIVVNLAHERVVSVVTQLVLGAYIVGANKLRQESTSASLIYKYLFVVDVESVSDPTIYVMGLVAKGVVVYQFAVLVHIPAVAS